MKGTSTRTSLGGRWTVKCEARTPTAGPSALQAWATPVDADAAAAGPSHQPGDLTRPRDSLEQPAPSHALCHGGNWSDSTSSGRLRAPPPAHARGCGRARHIEAGLARSDTVCIIRRFSHAAAAKSHPTTPTVNPAAVLAQQVSCSRFGRSPRRKLKEVGLISESEDAP